LREEPSPPPLRPGVQRVLVGRRPVYNGNVEQASSWMRASHPLRIVFSREFTAKRRRTEQELAEAASLGVVVVRLRGAARASRWLATQASS
jgi:hypothetical protein